VNYRIDSVGSYINQDKIRTKNAIAVIDISNPKTWKNIQEFELGYDRSIDQDNRYEGLEDIRLFEHKNQILYNANRGMPDGTMTVEHGLIDLSKESTGQNKYLEKENKHSIEKNWVLFSSANDKQKIIYNWSPLVIGDISEDKFVQTHSIETPYFFKYLRGSTNGVVIQNDLWFICHAVSYEDRRYYYHMIVVLDRTTFQLKKYTPFFTFEGEKVEYTLGFLYLEDSLFIGYSVYDNTTKYLSVKREDFENMMIDATVNLF